MNKKEQLDIFVAQTKNVRQLEKAWKHVQRTINHELAIDNPTSAMLHTKLLALIYCAWSEANFSKLLHTPYGFNLSEIEQIKKMAKEDILRGWKKCLELGLKKILINARSNYIPNIKLKVERFIDEYVGNPRLLRNKIAHGQWQIALNTKNDNINLKLTHQMTELNVVQIFVWRKVYQGLSNIIEAMIESPKKSFHKSYYDEIKKVESLLKETKNWTLKNKIKLLKEKKSHKNK